jgi:flagellar hook protein FlgE
MLNVLSQAKNAILAYNTALEASSSNIAGMNVTGFKRLDVSFQTVFEKVLSRGTAATTQRGGTNPKQFGQGISISNVSVDFSAGDLVQGGSLDLAIQGQGLFVLSPDGGDSYLYTRAGNFEIDNSRNLLSNGMQVYGLDNSGNLTPISNLPDGDFRWTSDGYLENTTDGGQSYNSAGYQIALTYFPNPDGLVQAQGTSFAETPASGEAAAPQAPTGAAGTILPRFLEKSNVFYLGETVDALEIQRAITGNLAIVRMASDMLSQFISKLS